MVELEDHLHVTFGEALVAPAYVVVTRPSAVHVTVEEVVQTPAAVRQLAEALRQSARVHVTGQKSQALKVPDHRVCQRLLNIVTRVFFLSLPYFSALVGPSYTESLKYTSRPL